MAVQIFKGFTDATGNGGIMEKVNANGAIWYFGDGATGYNGIDVKLLGTSALNYMLWDESENRLNIVSAPNAWDATTFQISTTPVLTTAGVRNGAVNISSNRAVASIWATWDGNPDCGLKMAVYNYSASGANGAIRGLDITVRNRTGSCSWVNGGVITAENYVGAVGVVDVIGFEIHSKNNAVASGNVKGLRIFDESQSATGTTYGLEISCEGTSPFIREFGIHINANLTSGWLNAISFNDTITNVLDFENNDGTNGATYHVHGYTPTNLLHHIKIDIAGTTGYIPVYGTMTEI